MISDVAMTLKIMLLVLKFISIVKFVKSDFTSKIVGGEFSKIRDFPHSVHVSIYCNDRSSSCGASILNQVILLTAAHCFASCKRDFVIKAYTGSERKAKGFLSFVTRYKIHENYDDETKARDIALLRLEKPLNFGMKVQRVAIMRTPPKFKNAAIAGWGWIDSEGTKTNALKHATQYVFSRETCYGTVKTIPWGTFCGRDIKGNSYPERGDSGSALVAKDFIQIGLVSFKKRNLANDVVVYTNVSYFYDWIVNNAYDLYCNRNFKKLKWNKKVFAFWKTKRVRQLRGRKA